MTRADDPAVRSAALVAATLASFLTPFMGSATNVALPALGRELALDASSLGWIQSAYLLCAAVVLVPFGKLADTHGRKRVFVTGLVVYTLGSVLCGTAGSAATLLLARAVQGVGGGMIFGTSVALITAVFPAGRRGAALGLNTSAVYLGLSLGPVFGGVLTQQLGWRAVFLATGAVGVPTVVIAAHGLLPDPPRSRHAPFDGAGALLYGAALVATMYGLGLVPSLPGAALVLAGLAGLWAFVLWEQNVADPVLDMGLFLGNRVFALSNLAALVNYAATFAVSFLLSLHLQYVGGLGARAAGAVLAIQPLVQAGVSPIAGRLSDRVDARLVASTGMGIVAAGLGLLALAGPGTSLGLVTACLALLGVGFGLFSSPNTNAVMASIEPGSFGVGSATLATMRLVGQMLSMGLAGMVLTLFLGREAVVPSHLGAFSSAVRATLLLFCVLSVGGTFASLARGRTATAPRGRRDE